jgi:hypothetical protein
MRLASDHHTGGHAVPLNPFTFLDFYPLISRADLRPIRLTSDRLRAHVERNANCAAREPEKGEREFVELTSPSQPMEAANP